MARPASMVRFVLAGTLPNGEIWQTGFWAKPSQVVVTLALLNEWTAAVLSNWTNGPWATLLNATIPPTGSFAQVRGYYYPEPDDPALYQSAAAAGFVGTGAEGNSLPLQSALCLTLRTGLAGRRNNGRMFWPLLNENLESHQLTQARTQAIADAVADFFTNVRNLAGFPIPAVMSSVGVGSWNPISAVEVDSEPDVIRSRSNRAVELHTSSSAV